VTAVFDSSALIAWLDGEPEGARVDGIFAVFDEGEAELFAHSINLCEVFYHVLSDTDETTANQAIAMIKGRGVQERNDMDAAFWRDMGTTIVSARAMQRPDGTPANLALGDAFGVALSNRLDGVFVTKDRTEIEPLHDTGLVSANFIR
jgi:predicted nucleic acid-binding protein